MNKFSPKNYSIEVWWDEQTQEYVAQCIQIQGSRTTGKDPGKAVNKVYKQLHIDLKFAKDLDLEPPKPKKPFKAGNSPIRWPEN